MHDKYGRRILQDDYGGVRNMTDTERQIECTLDLCDIYERKLSHAGLNKVIKDGCHDAGFDYCDRLYIGSHFCSNYFDMMDPEQYMILNSVRYKLSLVIPITTQVNLEKVKQKLHVLIKVLPGIDEIIVNDYGMIKWVKENTFLNIRLGRLFTKTLRDPRYEQRNVEYDITGFQRSMIRQFGITGIEYDSAIPLAEDKGIGTDRVYKSIPKDINCSLYRPYSYLSVGQVCEYASIGKTMDKKFTPNAKCCRQCHKYAIEYKMKETEKFVRLGRAILISANRVVPLSRESYRDVFFPLT